MTNNTECKTHEAFFTEEDELCHIIKKKLQETNLVYFEYKVTQVKGESVVNITWSDDNHFRTTIKEDSI